MTSQPKAANQAPWRQDNEPSRNAVPPPADDFAASWTSPETTKNVQPRQPAHGAPPQTNGWTDDTNSSPRISPVKPRSVDKGFAADSGAFPGQGPRTEPRAQPVNSSNVPTPAQPTVTPANTASPKPGLFNLDDSAMDQLFKHNLGVDEDSKSMAGAPNVSYPTATQPIPEPTVTAPAQTEAQNQPSTGLFSIDDSVIDRIFADLVVEQQNDVTPKGPTTDFSGQIASAAERHVVSEPPALPNAQLGQPPYGAAETSNVPPAKSFSESHALPPHQVSPGTDINQQFGAASAAPPPKVQGVGRLDSRVDTNIDQGSGRIASIGKFLLDQKDIEKLGKITDSDLSNSSMRILTREAAQELQQLLHLIGQQEGVIGSVIVGHDGLLIANVMPADVDAESVGQWALGIYMNTATSIKKIGQDRVHQIVGKTPRGYIVIADFGGGLLVTMSNGQDTDALIPLMRSITQLVSQ